MNGAFSFPVLIGDIGGTNARFALVHDDRPVERFPNVRTADYANVSEAMRAAAAAGSGEPPKSAVVAFAGPLTNDTVELTNAPWVVEPRKAVERLGLECLVVLNDFEAQSLSLPVLIPEDLVPIGGGEIRDATKVVLGPGTGLGAGALLRVRGAWVPVASEGGHVDIGPVTERDFAVWPHIAKRDGRMSAEAIISGGGLLELYRAVCAADGIAAVHREPAEVTEAGLAGGDPAAAETLQLFAIHLGRFAGDIAMTFMAKGGVYLAGGIPARIAPALASGAFREGFADKAPHDDIMADIATVVVTARDAALRGIEALVRRPDSYVMDLDDRTFTR